VMFRDSYIFNLGILFQNVVRQHGSRKALWYDTVTQVSYDELNQLANRIARYLNDSCEIARGNVVCISGNKSQISFASMLACLKLGAVYSVLDPDSPVERLHKIISTCRPKAFVAEDNLLDQLGGVMRELGIKRLSTSLETISPVLDSLSDANLQETATITSSNPAYIMYTSGSTGFPKGAVMTHANVINLIEWSHQTFGINCDDVQTNVNPQYFDNSVFDFYSTLFAGACMVPFNKEEVRDPRRLVDKVAAAGCTVWFSVPSLLIFLQTLRATDGKNLESIRSFIFGGEGYPKAKLKLLYDTYKHNSKFFNVYGPTECTCICSSCLLSDDDFIDLQGFPPLGRIAENFSTLIIDDSGREAAPGEVGELCLLGPNVGRGYYNDPDRTAAGFVQNPNNSSYPEIMYKTGDLVHHNLTDDKLYIHGRKDNQIKHMGYRIELEEIETAFHHLDYVAEAAVIHTRIGDISRLIAVLALKQDREDSRIRCDLKQIIPDYMIPTEYLRFKILPKNANGKIDRKRLQDQLLNQQ